MYCSIDRMQNYNFIVGTKRKLLVIKATISYYIAPNKWKY